MSDTLPCPLPRPARALIVVALAVVLAAGGCARFPGLDDRDDSALAAAPWPTLVPLPDLLAQANAPDLAGPAGEALAARAAALRARAAVLRATPVGGG